MPVRKIAIAACAAVLLLQACSTPQAPDRSLSYGFADPVGDVFHWPTDGTPVSYWVEDRSAIPEYVAAALQTWTGQFLYGEWSGVVVGDSATADVIVLLVGPTPPDGPLTQDPPVRACFGQTTAVVVGSAIEGPIVTSLFWTQGLPPSDIHNCLARVTTHEIGHTLGLLDHSADPRDLMFTNPTVATPSQADRNTVQKLYHTAVTLQPPVR